MSLYNRLFGENPNADLLLRFLKLSRADFGRFRDIYATPDGHNIIVLTRIGGKNRPYFVETFRRLGAHPWILTASDEAYDNTYHTINFAVPEEHWGAVKALSTGPVLNASERFGRLALDELDGRDTPDTRRSNAFAREFAPKLAALAGSSGPFGAVFDTDTPEDLKPNVETLDV
jgi:hypothetical protein